MSKHSLRPGGEKEKQDPDREKGLAVERRPGENTEKGFEKLKLRKEIKKVRQELSKSILNRGLQAMNYLADTVTIVRHFSGAGRIGLAARLFLEGVKSGENYLFFSTLSLVEIFYLSEKKRIGIDLENSQQKTKGSRNLCAWINSFDFRVTVMYTIRNTVWR